MQRWAGRPIWLRSAEASVERCVCVCVCVRARAGGCTTRQRLGIVFSSSQVIGVRARVRLCVCHATAKTATFVGTFENMGTRAAGPPHVFAAVQGRPYTQERVGTVSPGTAWAGPVGASECRQPQHHHGELVVGDLQLLQRPLLGQAVNAQLAVDLRV